MSLVHSFPTEDMYEPQYLDSFQHIAREDSPVEVATPPPKSKLIRGRQKRTAQNVEAPYLVTVGRLPSGELRST
ncbi:hypothetical protein Tco_1157214 [Tanacetum coccineum]